MGGVAVTGSSIATTSAFATGSIAATSGAATGAAAGAAALGGAVVVVGAAGAALLAAYHLHKTYQHALGEYHGRIEGEGAEVQAASRARHAASGTALLQAQKTRVKAAELAELAFLRAGVRKLQRRLGDWPATDPTLPGACAQLLADLESPAPDLARLFASYEALGVAVGAWAARNREKQFQDSASLDTAALEALRASIGAEISELRDDISLAPPDVLSDSTRVQLTRALAQVESLFAKQPHMAEQGLKLLRGRVGRELALGAGQAAKLRAEQEAFSARLRELSGRISARSQATLSALESEELANCALARAPLGAIQTQALGHLKRLATLVAGELPADLAPLETLSREADALFEATGDQLRQLALQIYLESQVTEVFTQLGYRVSSVEGSSTGQAGLVATLDGGHGVEVRLDGQGHLSSELVAFSASSAAIQPQVQEKVCAVMDEVIEALRARGCGVREKKRRHFKRGEHNLRVVKAPARKTAPAGQASRQAATPLSRRIGE